MKRIPPRILIVDDHEDNVELLRARLEAWGYASECAGDGAEALRKIEESPPDLVLLDVMMPKMDGIEVAKRVKGKPISNAISFSRNCNGASLSAATSGRTCPARG